MTISTSPASAPSAPASLLIGTGPSVPTSAPVYALDLTEAPVALPAHSDANTGADAWALDLAGLPPQLRVLRHGAFYQLYSKNAGVLAPKAISFEDAGIDIEGVSRRLRTQKPQLSRIPEDVANPIASAVSAYLKVVRGYGAVLSVARAAP